MSKNIEWDDGQDNGIEWDVGYKTERPFRNHYPSEPVRARRKAPDYRITRRARSITAASIISWYKGLAGLIAGVLVFLVGISVSNALPDLGGLIITLGLYDVFISGLYIAAGRSLWHSKKKGAKLGIVACAVDLIIGTILAMTVNYEYQSYAAGDSYFMFSSILMVVQLDMIAIVLVVAMVILIGAGWRTLR